MFQEKNSDLFTPEDIKSMVDTLNPQKLNYFVSLAQEKLKNLYNLGYYDERDRDYDILKGRFKKGIRCPKCGGSNLNKNGRTNGRQRYICKKCRTTFDERSFSPLSNTKLSLDKWLNYCQFMVEGGSIRMCAEKVGVSVPTSFFMRHRILDMLNYFLKNEILDGIVDVEPCYINESFKGSRSENYQEEKYFSSFNFNGEDSLKAGGKFLLNTIPFTVKNPLKNVKPNQICINTAIDRNGHILTRIVDNDFGTTNNKIKPQNIVSFFKDKLGKDALLCAFNTSLYRDMTKKLGIKMKKVHRQREPLYTVKSVFRYHLDLMKWLRNFNGVATKYLNNYLAWFKFLFIGKNFKEFNRKKELFMDLATKNLYITQKMIKNRCIESM